MVYKHAQRIWTQSRNGSTLLHCYLCACFLLCGIAETRAAREVST